MTDKTKRGIAAAASIAVLLSGRLSLPAQPIRLPCHGRKWKRSSPNWNHG